MKANFHHAIMQVLVPLKHKHQQPLFQSLRCDLRDKPARAAEMWSLSTECEVSRNRRNQKEKDELATVHLEVHCKL